MEDDDDLVGALDDVIVGDDEAFLAIDDKAGAERGHLAVGLGLALTFLLKKSSKNSSNGDPFGTLGSGTPCGPLTVWEVEMLTTASISFSASGATDWGPPPAEPRLDSSAAITAMAVAAMAALKRPAPEANRPTSDEDRML